MGEGPATPASSGSGDAKFGEAPLAQTVAAAGAMRRLSSLLLSLEQPHPTVDVMLAKFDEWESELAAAAPTNSAPRIGEIDDDPRRVYLSHATDIGAYNPCFPEYSFDHLDAEKCRRPGRLPGGLRRAAGTGARRLSGGLLRLRHPASQLRHRLCPARRGDFRSPTADPRRC